MELEQLKNVWQKTSQREIEGYFVSFKDVQSLLRKRSNTTVSQIKRGIRNKILMSAGIGLILLSFATYVLLTNEPVISFVESFSSSEANLNIGIFYLVFGLVVCFISVFNGVSYRQIVQIENKKGPLKSSIKNILAIVRNAMQAKIYSDTLVIPSTVFILLIADLIRGTEIFSNNTLLLISVTGAIGFGVFSYFLTKRGQYQRYGEQIESLEKCLQELQVES